MIYEKRTYMSTAPMEVIEISSLSLNTTGTGALFLLTDMPMTTPPESLYQNRTEKPITACRSDR
jgi:hypothetical protein